MREAELEEVKQAIESVRTETRALNENAPLGQPLMEGPATKPAPAKGEAKPAAKAPRKRAASKAKPQAKTAAKRAKGGAEPAP
jgi:hypothetical protein